MIPARSSRPLCLLAMAFVAACSSDDGSSSPAPVPDTTAPTVALQMTPYTAIEGIFAPAATWDDDKGVTRIDVLLDGAIAAEMDLVSSSFDSSTFPPGVHELALEATDAAGNTARTSAVLAVFAGPGKFLALTETDWGSSAIPGWSGKGIAVEPGATSVEHVKVHVDVPSGTKALRAMFRWEMGTSWGLGFDTGTGECPDSGTQLATMEVTGLQAFASIEVDDEGADLSVGQWFGHVRFLDPENHGGETLALSTLFLALPE